MTRTEAFIAATLAALMTLAVHYALYAHPTLVGHGCIGSSGDLYAEEEDHFPSCVKIERL